MKDSLDEYADDFVILYRRLYLFLVKDYKRRTGRNLKEYKSYEPTYLKKAYLNYTDKSTLIDQVSHLASTLITIQALPNANHRTAFLFTKYYLKKHGVNMKIYSEEKKVYDQLYEKSKFLIEREINHNQLFNDSYMDVHHDQAVRKHEKHMKKLMKEIVILPQSGIRTVESFHSFVASINQSGSFPFLNQ
ncbi:MAG: hypothetical protein R6U21_05205 [Thermoplasmatota archaeon]